MPKLYAHTLEDRPVSEWETYEDHAWNVARGADARADQFGAGWMGEACGLLHDLGKAKQGFQDYLKGGEQVPHAVDGARKAFDLVNPNMAQLMAYIIAGHHTGLPNGRGEAIEGASPTVPLEERLLGAVDVPIPPGTEPSAPKPPKPLTGGRPDHFEIHFFTRMLFSALVDADFMETEAFMWGRRREASPALAPLRKALNKTIASFGEPTTFVNEVRARVQRTAGERASLEPGLFSMTVPTGGAKTLASLKFALEHAKHHGHRRIIYVAPFNAIIEQTASEFRKALGNPDAVLEHHSSFDPMSLEDEKHQRGAMMAAQNWDRPVVVTTAVQFFESLFANRTSKCRKLHNIANSVIILDEAQSLPILFMRPCLAAIQELCRAYGCSIVLCTATQPAVLDVDGLEIPEALPREKVRELAPDPEQLHHELKRVDIHNAGRVGNQELCNRIRGRQALVIVNNKTHARDLYDQMRGGEGVFHLTTNMTALHRRAVLQQVKARLDRRAEEPDIPITLFATALIEAGVNIDFPEVWRAVAGIDSIAQAAGRCNRNGKMERPGQVYIFEPTDFYIIPPEIKQNAEAARAIIPRFDDLLHPDTIRAYFQRLYSVRAQAGDLDGADIMDMIGVIARSRDLNYPFANIAALFKLIQEVTVPLIIGVGEYGLTREAERTLRTCPAGGVISREMQNFTISINTRTRQTLIDRRLAEVVRADEFGDSFVVLRAEALYDPSAGFSIPEQF